MRTIVGSLSRRRGNILIAPGLLQAPLVLTRSQSLSESVSVNTIGVWSTFGANTPRFFGASQVLLLETQRTNQFRNPRAEGRVAGTPGTLPTNWGLVGLGTLTSEVINAGGVSGVDCLTLRISGNPAAPGTALLTFESGGQIATTTSQAWTSSVFLSLAITSGLTPALALANEERAADGTTLTDADASAPALSVSDTLARFARFRSVVGATSARLVPTLRIDYAAGSYDFTLVIGWPQVEQATFQTTPVLPPIGSPAVSTRGRDTLTSTLTALSIPASGAGTYLWKGALTAENTATTALFSVSDLSTNNQFGAFQVGTNITLRRSIGAVNSDATVAAPARGTEFVIGMTIDGAGRAALTLNGGAMISVTGGSTTGLTTALVGSLGAISNATNPILVRRFETKPSVLPDAVLQAIAAVF